MLSVNSQSKQSFNTHFLYINGCPSEAHHLQQHSSKRSGGCASRLPGTTLTWKSWKSCTAARYLEADTEALSATLSAPGKKSSSLVVPVRSSQAERALTAWRTLQALVSYEVSASYGKVVSAFVGAAHLPETRGVKCQGHVKQPSEGATGTDGSPWLIRICTEAMCAQRV